MPHDLFKGKMAWVDQVPWHGLGTKVPAEISAADMIRAANLAWSVSVRPAPGARRLKRDIYDHYLIERDPVELEKEKVVLGLAGRRYTPLQNVDAFGFFEPFIKNKWATFCTAGALGNGQRVWVQAQFSGEIVITPRDKIQKFILLSNSHNGSGAVKILFTPIRVVCQNTLNFSLKNQHSLTIKSISHTKHIAERLVGARTDALKRVIDSVFSEAETLFSRMAGLKIDADDTAQFLKLLFPQTGRLKTSDEKSARWERVLATLDDNRITPSETRNTLWALYNAVVWDEDYRSSRESDRGARLERVWFGRGQELKIRALNIAQDLLARAG
jgi:phage/plasmid-like protein (TIGR03299 family)